MKRSGLNAVLIVVLVALNVWDAVFTHYGLQSGQMVEVNPLMAWAYALGPLFFFVMKGGILSIALIPAWVMRHEKSMTVFLAISVALYYLLFSYQVFLGVRYLW